MCTHSAAGAIKASVQFCKAVCGKEKKVRKERSQHNEEAEVRRRTLSSALGVESLESGRVPWVRLKSIVWCITQMVHTSSENFVNDEGALPLGLELVLFLLW